MNKFKKYRRFDSINNIKLYMMDLYKEADETVLTEKQRDNGKYKLSILKSMMSCIKLDNDKELKELNEKFEIIEKHGYKVYQEMFKNNDKVVNIDF
ncbi:MAG: hypothetical protein ACFFDF_03875 [Candidatus Odinarchaeota archaeon]